MIKIKPLWTYEIADILNAERPCKNILIKSISTDSREAFEESTCFVAIKGNNFDGENYIDEAVKKGAKCIIASKKKSVKVPFIEAFDTKKALLRLGSQSVGKTKIIGVTGSVGKTTVKEMVCSVLAQKFKTSSSYENHNNELGVAETLLSIDDEDFCVVEMGMRGLKEIDLLAEACKPYISIITNAESAHIEKLGTKENIFKAKCEILNYTKEFAIVPFEKRFKDIDYGKIKPIFIGNGADVEIGRHKASKTGIIADIIDNNLNNICRIRIPSIFLHDAENAMLAYTAGKLCGVSDDDIKKGILEFKICKNRGKVLKIGKITVIDDCYNASPEGVRGAILSLVSYARYNTQKPYLLLGDMLEIGESAPNEHYEIGKLAKEKGVFNVLSYGKYAHDLCRGFGGGVVFESIEELENYIVKKLDEGSLLLVKASRAMHFENIIKDLKERIDEN